jgi:hypothetical protein
MTDVTSPARDAPLVAWVGFAGHRDVDAAALAPRLAQAFDLVARAFAHLAEHRVRPGAEETVADAHAAIWPGARSTHALHLLTGAAPGADRAAIAAWRDGGRGEVFAVFPFADPTTPDAVAWTDDPHATDRSLAVALRRTDGGPAFDRVGVLDGAAARDEVPARHPHLAQTRRIVAWSDLLVAVWNGAAAAGDGGTGDAVALALEREIPVLWIDPTSSVLRLLCADALWSDSAPSEVIAAIAGARDLVAPAATVDRLAELLLPVFTPPHATAGDAHGGDEETAMRHDHAATAEGGRPLPTTGGPIDRFARAVGLLTLHVWRWSRPAAAHREPRNAAPTPPARDAGAEVVEAAFRRADARATTLGELHRSVQVLLLIIAVLAVVFGTSAAVVPAIKPYVVAFELTLVITASVVWKFGFVAHNHRRWGDVRRLAERLRALRATRFLGFDVGDRRRRAPTTWTEWEADAIRRRAGPPTGFQSAAALKAAWEHARLDRDGIVMGQSRYHVRNGTRLLDAHHRLETVEKIAFAILVATLGAFLLWDVVEALIGRFGGRHELEHGASGAAHAVFAGVVLWVSAVVPTIAAACLAAEAKLGLEENGRRSLFFAEEFSALDRELAATASVAEAGEILRRAGHLLLSDIDWWREAAVRRRISTF